MLKGHCHVCYKQVDITLTQCLVAVQWLVECVIKVLQ